MDKLSYLLTFIAIIVGIGVSDMIVSLNRLISNSKKVIWHFLPIVWAINIFLALIYYFYIAYAFIDFDMSNFGIGFVALVIPQLVLLFLALAIFPNKVGKKGINLLSFYFLKKKYIGILFILHFWGIWALRVFEYSIIDNQLYNPKLGMLVFPVLLFSSIIWTKKVWLHTISAILVLTYFLYFLSNVSLNI